MSLMTLFPWDERNAGILTLNYVNYAKMHYWPYFEDMGTYMKDTQLKPETNMAAESDWRRQI